LWGETPCSHVGVISLTMVDESAVDVLKLSLADAGTTYGMGRS
jgi:hypothetical protein